MKITHVAERVTSPAANKTSIVTCGSPVDENVVKVLLEKCSEVDSNAAFIFLSAVPQDLLFFG